MKTDSGRGLRRHLEGWPLGLGVVLTTALTAALTVPRKVEPDFVPAPVIDRTEQRRELDVERERAERAKAGLPLEVRSVGEAFRRFGAAALREDAPAILPQLSAQLRRLTDVAIERRGNEKLLELRAVQAELFIAAMVRRRSDGAPDAELRELGGKLLASGLERAWFEPHPGAADELELGGLFRIYWAETLGLARRHPFAPTLNEWRAHYRFLLARPLAAGEQRAGDVQRRLGYVAALAQHDQDYPARLARGGLFYQRGAYAESAGELQAHLARFPDGPWTLRARNYLAACGATLTE